jgi:hypothetical protein
LTTIGWLLSISTQDSQQRITFDFNGHGGEDIPDTVGTRSLVLIEKTVLLLKLLCDESWQVFGGGAFVHKQQND